MVEGEELAWLLKFFSQGVEEQWRQVPDSMKRTWLAVGNVEAAVDQPIKLMVMVLSEHLNGCYQFLESGLDSPAVDVLWQLRILLAYFLLEGPYAIIFAKLKEPEQLHAVWGVVSRLCLVALDEPEVMALLVRDFNLAYFCEKYGAEIVD